VPWLLPVTGTGWRPAPHARPGDSRAAGGRSEASRFMPAARSPAQRRSPAGPGPWIGGLPPLADAAGRRAGRPSPGPRGRPARLRPSGDPGRVLDVIEHADHLADWLNAADLPSVAVLGNSFGCQVAVELAVCHPDRVAGLVLVDPTMDPSARTAPPADPRATHGRHSCAPQARRRGRRSQWAVPRPQERRVLDMGAAARFGAGRAAGGGSASANPSRFGPAALLPWRWSWSGRPIRVMENPTRGQYR
jgi:pimeloyl-ACP methyl ester carboxylesterase